MTPDLDEIRAALAAASPAPWHPDSSGRFIVWDEKGEDIAEIIYDGDHQEWATTVLVANAPTWLATLVEEVERLRIEVSKEPDHSVGYTLKLVAERDAALADLDRAVKMFGKAEEQAWADLRATKDSFLEQRDEARAEVRRLKARLERPMVHTTIAESCAQSGCAALHLSTHEDRADDQ